MVDEQRKVDCLLTSYRALDLTDEKGFLCGRLLGDFGVDVIKVEKPGGDPARSIGPFYHNIPDPEKSLYWFAFNANKRGVTLDIETPDGSLIFKRLVKTADFVIESFPPGYMDRIGLGYPVLSDVNPRVIMTSISPFGQTGPYKDYKGDDIVVSAMSGLMKLSGDRDRAPTRVSFPQSHSLAGAQAALGTLMAHYYRERTGEGQWVDTSMQESMLLTTYSARLYWEFNNINLVRAGPYRVGFASAYKQRVIYPCKDGWVSYISFGGPSGGRSNRALIESMDSEGMAPDFLKSIDWDAFDMFKATEEELSKISAPIADFFARHTKEELYQEAIKRRFMLHPVFTAKDIVEDIQLEARDFWQEVEHSELNTHISYPGTCVRLSEANCCIRRRAPLIGEHNDEIYRRELGLAREELVTLTQNSII